MAAPHAELSATAAGHGPLPMVPDVPTEPCRTLAQGVYCSPSVPFMPTKPLTSNLMPLTVWPPWSNHQNRTSCLPLFHNHIDIGFPLTPSLKQTNWT